jgi:Oxysterol-binding protein
VSHTSPKGIADVILCILYTALTCAKTLKTVLSAYSNIISQDGISNLRASRSREPFIVSPRVVRPPFSRTTRVCHVDTIPSWANSSGADMTIRTVRRDFTSQNRVRLHAVLHPNLPVTPSSPISIPSAYAYTVSHHPPISAFFYVSPANKVAIVGEFRPKSKFLGNSVSTTMEGESRITLMGRPEDAGKYFNCVPNRTAPGSQKSFTILFFSWQSTC